MTENSNIRNISTPLLVEAVEGITIYNMPTWKSDGFLNNVGEQRGNTRFYSPYEVGAVAAAVALARGGLGLKAAFEAVFDNPSPAMIAALAGHGDAPLVFWPRRDPGAGLALTYSVKVVVDVAAIVRATAARLDVVLTTERHRPRRRLAFEPAPAGISR